MKGFLIVLFFLVQSLCYIDTPIAFGYINTVQGSSWWHNPDQLFLDLGVPGP